MTPLEVRLPPDQLAELADLIAQRLTLPTSAPAPVKLAYTIPEASTICSRTKWQIRMAIRTGELHATKPGRTAAYTILHTDLDAWLRGVPTTTLTAREGVRQRAKAR